MMAILQTRPSPLYIFDEIDSAMDMSHTSKMYVYNLPVWREALLIPSALLQGSTVRKAIQRSTIRKFA